MAEVIKVEPFQSDPKVNTEEDMVRITMHMSKWEWEQILENKLFCVIERKHDGLI